MEQTTYTVSRHPMPGSRQSILLAPALILLTGLSSATVTLRTGAAENAQNAVDHAGMIRSWDQAAYGRGRALYNSICLTCHGNLTQQGTLPTSRAFWKEPFKNGTDPYRIYQTLSQGYGQMPAWTFMTPRQRYDVIHYVRETFLRPHNPSAYFKVDSDYLGDLPKAGSKPFKKTPEMIAFEKGPKYRRMDFGPALFWTFQVAPRNIAYKGIAIRLDDGPGGVSKGRAWMVYDHDTMRVAAAWTGEKFVNWKGIAFDGSHGTHTSIVGDKLFVNPVGPGWADPQTGDFADPRFLGRDKKPYGPLPRTWTHFKGVYLHSNRVVVAYTVGDANILEQPRLLQHRGRAVFSRNLDVGESSHDLLMRIAPTNVSAAIVGASQARVTQRDGHNLLHIPKTATPLQLTLVIEHPTKTIPFPESTSLQPASSATADFRPVLNGGPPRWNPPLATRGVIGKEDGPFAVDIVTPPKHIEMPWHSWMRFGGFDFFKDHQRLAICTWNGDVWLVSGIDDRLEQLVWKRIASGLFQPLGVKIVDETIYVACRDQIARLHDLNGDEEIDFIENFNNDHQVTEHFHEFAMGLQTDAKGDFYYAKSARHALTAIVPHHGTLLKVSKDGSRTEIVANGFRAANGVCVNEDGSFIVTDQEGHWTPKNRINWVEPGKFYGNIFGYHDQTSTADDDMEQPLVWVTNEMDRSPGELLWITHEAWGTLRGSLLNLSYGTGRIFVVPYEKVDGQRQGGVARLPIPEFPTGVMRGRFDPSNGHLYACGMYAWAGNRQADGGFYRIRPTGKPAWLPIKLKARQRQIEIGFTDVLDPAYASQAESYAVKVWSLHRSASYGSKHIDERTLKVEKAVLLPDQRSVVLTVPELAPTRGMEIRCELRGNDGTKFSRKIHNTIYELGTAAE